MAIVNGNELLNLTGAALAVPTLSASKTNGARVQYVAATLEVAAADDNASTFRVARLPSNVILKEIKVGCDAITAGTDYDLGIAYANGAVIDANNLADALDFSSASKFALDGLKDVAIENLGKELWQLAGLTVDPNSSLDILLTANAIGTAAGTISFKIEFTN